MTDYTPTTEWVRVCVGYAKAMAKDRTLPVEAARQEGYDWFDRWLAADRKAQRAEAVRDAARWLDTFEGPGGRTSLHDQVGRDLIRLLCEYANRIETSDD